MPQMDGTRTKAYIVNLETGEEIQCLFNPREYAFAKSNSWASVEVTGQDVPLPEFLSGGAITLTMQLFFDTYAEGTDVRNYTEKLLNLMKVDPDLRDSRTQQGRPPRCRFHWGQTWAFEAIVTQIRQSFTLFLGDGTPVRATCDVTFQQVGEEGTYPAQNPTTGAGPNVRVWTVRPGDRLDWIAHKEYGDSTRWRPIAEANGIDDPIDLKSGQQLVIPPR